MREEKWLERWRGEHQKGHSLALGWGPALSDGASGPESGGTSRPAPSRVS